MSWFVSHRRTVLLIAVLCFIMLLPGLGTQTMVRQQELRVALTARGMVETGDWLIPYFLGQPRMNKPPLMYWLTAISYSLAGTVQSAFAARLPTALLGIAFLVTIALGGVRWVDRRAAALAAILALFSFSFQRYGRMCETDIPQVLFTTLTILSGYMALTGEKPGRWWLATGVCSGLGFMVKGPASLVLPILTLIFFACWDGQARRRLLSWRPLLFFIPFTLIAAPWYVAVMLVPRAREAMEAAAEFEMEALLSEGAHPGPFYYYTYTVLKVTLPWAGLLPFALWDMWRRRREGHGPKILLSWFGVTFVVLSCLSNKQAHYALLLLPSSFMMIAEFIVRAVRSERSWQTKVLRWYLALLFLVFTAAVAALFYIVPKELGGFGLSSVLLIVLMLGFVCFGWYAWWKKSSSCVILAVCTMMAVGTQAYLCCGQDVHRPESVMVGFAQQAKPYAMRAPAVFFVGHRKASLDFYMGLEPREMANLDHAWTVSPTNGVILAVASEDDQLDFDSIPVRPELHMKRQDVRCALYIKR